MLPGFSFFFRRRAKHLTEVSQLQRLRAPHMLHEHELAEIHDDQEAGYARELAVMEIERRAWLSPQDRTREAARRWQRC